MEPHGSKREPLFNAGGKLLALYPADFQALRLEREAPPNYWKTTADEQTAGCCWSRFCSSRRPGIDEIEALLSSLFGERFQTSAL